MIYKTAAIIFCIIVYACIAYAETPQSPNLEELCESSELVLSAKFLSETSEVKKINHVEYILGFFEIGSIYKGDFKEKKISIYIPKIIDNKPRVECRRYPNYEPKEKYIFFLKKTPFSDIFIRIGIDDFWEERKATDDYVREIIDEVAFLADPDKWKKPSDNLSYTIHPEAIEKLVELTPYQKNNGFLKQAEYWHNGRLVGKKAWYVNGKLAFEEPFKNGMRHGITKSWKPNGSSFEIRPYRKGRLHGILMQWDAEKELKLSFWILGEPVIKQKYIRESKTNVTLQKMEAEKRTKRTTNSINI